MVQDHFTHKKFYKVFYMVQGIIEKTGLMSGRSLLHKCTLQKCTQLQTYLLTDECREPVSDLFNRYIPY